MGLSAVSWAAAGTSTVECTDTNSNSNAIMGVIGSAAVSIDVRAGSISGAGTVPGFGVRSDAAADMNMIACIGTSLMLIGMWKEAGVEV